MSKYQSTSNFEFWDSSGTNKVPKQVQKGKMGWLTLKYSLFRETKRPVATIHQWVWNGHRAFSISPFPGVPPCCLFI